MNITFKRLAILLTLIASSLSVSLAYADNNKTYCGSGLTTILVPDNALGCNFAEACKAHDKCYGKCDKNGELVGSEYCGKSEFSKERIASKQQCDNQLQADIKSINQGNPKCDILAGIYKTAVKILGQGPFNGKPMPPDMINNIVNSSKTPEEAGEKFETLNYLILDNVIDPTQVKFEDKQISVQTLPKSEFYKDKNIVIPNGENSKNLME